MPYLSRRDFVQYAAVTGLAAATPIPTSPLNHAAPSSPLPRIPTPSPFELEDVSVAQLKSGLESGRYTSRRLCQLYLARIEEIDRRGGLRSVIETNPDALAIADRADAERRAGRGRGALHGIPVLIKDNIATGDKMKTTAGSLALADAPAPRDAFVAQRLREAGA
ncbi:MAG TPA: amidase family protein, partial [Gemmatimonadales bacterium]|nr:amidase family protein [Gemmatimonadales bacterium]